MNVSQRLTRRLALLVCAIGMLASTALAEAVITGKVANPAGVPLDSVSVTLNDANNQFSSFATTDENGGFSVTPGAGDPAPFSIVATEPDSCRPFGDPARNASATAGGLADGATGLVITLDVRDFCQGSPPTGAPPPTGIVDGAARRIVMPAGGVAYVQARLPSGAVDPRILLADGTRVSPPRVNSFDDLQLNAPAGAYNGPLQLQFGTSGGATITRNMGTLVVLALSFTPAAPGVPYDVEAIVDISGSMGGTDPKFLRKDAVSLLADLSGTADGLGAVGFDSAFQPIFDLTRTSSQSVINVLKARARARIINRGGTDYNIGMDKAWEALNAPGVDPNKPKLVIFLTDGGHNAGTYNNGHLRFAAPGAFNGVTQRSWPVCAVQLGPPSSFVAADVARLKRIASETGGRYFATQSAAKLSDIYFRCRGQGTGQRALLTRVFVFAKANQKRQFARLLRRNLKQATFFVSSGGTFTFQIALRDPRGRLITPSTKRVGVVFRRGGTFAFFRITRPIAGSWRVIITAKRITAPRGQGQVTISVPTK